MPSIESSVIAMFSQRSPGLLHSCSFLTIPSFTNSQLKRATDVQALHRCPRRLSVRSRDALVMSSQHTTVLIVPTGVGAAIGGYAGDSLPAARLLSQVTDTLITHPNVLNGALMYWPIPNALYVEGYALDRFACGKMGLSPVPSTSNRLGIVLDSGMPEEAILRHRQAADAARATLGLNITHCTTTPKPLVVELASSKGGASWGTIADPQALLHSVQHLVKHSCQAIAVVSQFPEEDQVQLANYRSGNAIDAIAGAEAVISHLVTREFHVPCAHSPSLQPLPADGSVSPKAAAEELGYTFLSCVLVGLSRAPHLISNNRTDVDPSVITAANVDVLVIPANAFGSPAVLSLAGRADVMVIAVDENVTTLDVTASSVGIDESRVVHARSYAEAAGLVAAHRAGIAISSLQTAVAPLQIHPTTAPSTDTALLRTSDTLQHRTNSVPL